MPRQVSSTAKQIQFPDGFMMEISADGGSTYKEVGILAGGATATFNWTNVSVDAGNYEDLEDYAKDFMVALAPSNVWNFDPDVIAALFPGFMKSTAATSPGTGKDVEFAGTSRKAVLTKCIVRLTHYTVEVDGTETDSDIDWQFTLKNATVDAGGSINFKGVNEDGYDEVSVSFTGKPNPSDSFKLFTFFKVSA